jgi:hypothetical protein
MGQLNFLTLYSPTTESTLALSRSVAAQVDPFEKANFETRILTVQVQGGARRFQALKPGYRMTGARVETNQALSSSVGSSGV